MLSKFIGLIVNFVKTALLKLIYGARDIVDPKAKERAAQATVDIKEYKERKEQEQKILEANEEAIRGRNKKIEEIVERTNEIVKEKKKVDEDIKKVEEKKVEKVMAVDSDGDILERDL